MEENNNEDSQRDLNPKQIEAIIYTIGAILIIGGLAFAINLYLDYKYRFNPQMMSWFNDKSGFQDLATALTGTTGLLWALAGTIFFLYTIYLTKTEIKLQIQEMNQTNQTLKEQLILNSKQQAESTFFNLLTNQKNLVSNFNYNSEIGINALNQQTDFLISALDIYKDSITSKRFDLFEYTKYNPINLFGTNDQIKTLADSCIHIIDFIIEKLNDDGFYHKTFYFNLSNSEKYIIGYVLENNLYDYEESLPYYYTEHFKNNTNFFNIEMDGYFPICDISIPDNLDNPFYIDDLNAFKNFIESTTSYSFKCHEEVTIKKMKYSCEYKFEYNKFGGFKEELDLGLKAHVINSNPFNLLPLFEEFITNKYINNATMDGAVLTVKSNQFSLVVLYKDALFEIKLPRFLITLSKTRDGNRIQLVFS